MPKEPLLPAKPYALSLENRGRAMLTGVSEVLEFNETQVTLLTGGGEVTLTGEGLHVTRLMLEEGQLTVEGRVDGVVYQEARRRGGLWRVFK